MEKKVKWRILGADVAEQIRVRYATELVTMKTLAREYGCSTQAISLIVTGCVYVTGTGSDDLIPGSLLSLEEAREQTSFRLTTFKRKLREAGVSLVERSKRGLFVRRDDFEAWLRSLPQPQTVEEVFWGQVDKTGDCWVWNGRRDKNGYGRFSWRGTYYYAHRLAYELANGRHPGEFFVCHRCDNPPCVNPAHHFLGTPAENVADRTAKGRSGHPRQSRRIALAVVRAIQAEYDAGGIGTPALAKKYGVGKATAWKIACRREAYAESEAVAA